MKQTLQYRIDYAKAEQNIGRFLYAIAGTVFKQGIELESPCHIIKGPFNNKIGAKNIGHVLITKRILRDDEIIGLEDRCYDHVFRIDRDVFFDEYKLKHIDNDKEEPPENHINEDRLSAMLKSHLAWLIQNKKLQSSKTNSSIVGDAQPKQLIFDTNTEFTADLKDPESPDLTTATLQYSIMASANLSGISFFKSNLNYTNLEYANLHKAGMGNTNIRSCDFNHANLSESNLEDVLAENSNFRYANLRNADMSGGDFTDCDFSHADLRGATINNANFTNCKFKHTNTIGLDFDDTRSIEDAEFYFVDPRQFDFFITNSFINYLECCLIGKKDASRRLNSNTEVKHNPYIPDHIKDAAKTHIKMLPNTLNYYRGKFGV